MLKQAEAVRYTGFIDFYLDCTPVVTGHAVLVDAKGFKEAVEAVEMMARVMAVKFCAEGWILKAVRRA